MYGSADGSTHSFFRQYIKCVVKCPKHCLLIILLLDSVKRNVISVQDMKAPTGTNGAALLILNPVTRWS